eukprot:1194220-Prorocentrum_minimum.AAC.6
MWLTPPRRSYLESWQCRRGSLGKIGYLSSTPVINGGISFVSFGGGGRLHSVKCALDRISACYDTVPERNDKEHLRRLYI